MQSKKFFFFLFLIIPVIRRRINFCAYFVVFMHKKVEDLKKFLINKRREEMRGLKRTEMDPVLKAMGIVSGHWYFCPNKHPYHVGMTNHSYHFLKILNIFFWFLTSKGECGGPMQVSKCPECGAPIGGSLKTFHFFFIVFVFWFCSIHLNICQVIISTWPTVSLPSQMQMNLLKFWCKRNWMSENMVWLDLI